MPVEHPSYRQVNLVTAPTSQKGAILSMKGRYFKPIRCSLRHRWKIRGDYGGDGYKVHACLRCGLIEVVPVHSEK